MALKPGDVANFKTLKRAMGADHLALVECKDAKTGEYRAVLCAMNWDGNEWGMTPLGHMCTGNPFEDYTPPVPGE